MIRGGPPTVLRLEEEGRKSVGHYSSGQLKNGMKLEMHADVY